MLLVRQFDLYNKHAPQIKVLNYKSKLSNF